MNGSYYARWCLLYFWPPNTENPFLWVKDVMLTVWWYVNLSPCKHEGDNLLQMRSKFRDRPTCSHHLLITGTLNFISNPSSRLPIHTEAVLDGLCVVKKTREDVKLTGECRWGLGGVRGGSVGMCKSGQDALWHMYRIPRQTHTFNLKRRSFSFSTWKMGLECLFYGNAENDQMSVSRSLSKKARKWQNASQYHFSNPRKL